MMSGRNPSGTFTKPGQIVVGTPVPKTADQPVFCGCCCSISRSALTVIIAFLYLAAALLSGIAVGAGVKANISYYRGQVLVGADFTVTKVSASQLNIRTGWLQFSDGTSKGTRDITDLSGAAGALGYVSACLLLISLITATMKLISILVSGSRYLRRGSICLGMFVSLIMIVILTGLFVSTASNLNSYAHTKLGMPSSNTISMVPGYAWHCGFFAALTWTVVAIFTFGLPNKLSQEYHQF